MRIEYPEGATPLDLDAIAGLIPDLSTQREPSDLEAQNIAVAVLWAERSRTLKRGFPTPASLTLLHKRMFDQTWRWAGQFRKSDTNIGLPWYQAQVALQNLEALREAIRWTLRSCLVSSSPNRALYQ